MRQITHEVGALLIFDEVITFRLGYRGAQGVWGIDPDLTTLGKIIGGGFPVGAIGGHKEFMAVFDPSSGKPALPHGGTFSANPVTMRAGLVAMELLDEAAFARLDVSATRFVPVSTMASAKAACPEVRSDLARCCRFISPIDRSAITARPI